MHTGVLPKRTESRARPSTTTPLALSSSLTRRTSDIIGHHPAAAPIDPTDAAAMHYEAQFAHRFGETGQDLGSVLSSSDTAAAVRFQQEVVEKAKAMSPTPKPDTTAIDGTTVRADGSRMDQVRCIPAARNVYQTSPGLYFSQALHPCLACFPLCAQMTFDAIYSNAHVNKDTESAIGVGLVPVIDPRCITRPKALRYGIEHRVQTPYGMKALLPSRSFMGIGEGPGRAIDF